MPFLKREDLPLFFNTLSLYSHSMPFIFGHSTHQFSLCLQFLPPSSLPSAFESHPSSFGTRHTHCLPGTPHGLCPALPPCLCDSATLPLLTLLWPSTAPHLHPSSPRAHLLSFCSFFKVQPRTRLTQTLIGCQGSLANTFSSYSTIIK